MSYGIFQYLPLDENHGTGVDITSNYGRTKYFCEQMMTDAARIDPVRKPYIKLQLRLETFDPT